MITAKVREQGGVMVSVGGRADNVLLEMSCIISSVIENMYESGLPLDEIVKMLADLYEGSFNQATDNIKLRKGGIENDII